MKPDRNAPHSTRDLRIAAALFAIALIAMHLFYAAKGRGIMREQHLGTAVEFAKGKIDMLHPVVLGANANGVPTILEFPIWQAIVALLMKVFGIWYGWGNVVSLAFHLSTLWPLLRLGRRIVSERATWWGALLYLAQPLTFWWGGMASADSAAAALAVWFCYFAVLTLESGSWGLCTVATLSGILSIVTKPPFFMTVGLFAFFYLVRLHRLSVRRWLQVVLMGAIPCVVFAAWWKYGTWWMDRSEMSIFTSQKFTADSDAMEWWFGGLAKHFSPRLWMEGGWHWAIIMFGCVPFAVLPVIGCIVTRSPFLRWWMVAALFTTLVCTNIVLVHYHYFFIFALPTALLTAVVAERIENPVWELVPPKLIVHVVVLCLALGASLAQGLERICLRGQTDPYVAEQAAIIRTHTASTDRILVWNQGWGTPFMFAQRYGLTFPKLEVLEDSAKLKRLKELGYTHLILMNRSPIDVGLRLAAQKGNGAFDLPSQLPPVARGWPVVFSSDHLLILKIPN